MVIVVNLLGSVLAVSANRVRVRTGMENSALCIFVRPGRKITSSTHQV